MPTQNKTQELIASLESSGQFLVDNKIVFTDEQIALELERRQAQDNDLAFDRQRELNQMFPNRTGGKLYAQLETTEIFDF